MRYVIVLAMLLSFTVAEAYQTEVGFSDLPLELMFVSICESNTRQQARGPYGEIGLFQIHPKYHAEKAKKLGFNIYDFKGNAAYALWLYGQEGLKPWLASKSCWNKWFKLSSIPLV